MSTRNTTSYQRRVRGGLGVRENNITKLREQSVLHGWKGDMVEEVPQQMTRGGWPPIRKLLYASCVRQGAHERTPVRHSAAARKLYD